MADKQTALVESIAQGVHAKQAAEFKAIAEAVAKLTVTCNATLARLETLESAAASGGATAKRAVRSGAAAKKGGAAKAGGAKKPTGSDASKVTNALLYFRHAMANDLDDSRATHGTEENLGEAEKDATVSKKDRTKDESGYFSAVGAYLWKTVLTDEQKNEVRAQFTAWKEQAARDDAEPQLEEDAADDE